jgi:hypothetical protein
MSDHVTWEVCIRCGRLAAVGWVFVGRSAASEARNRPVEFDCWTGCRIGPHELDQAYGLLARRPPSDRAG